MDGKRNGDRGVKRAPGPVIWLAGCLPFHGERETRGRRSCRDCKICEKGIFRRRPFRREGAIGKQGKICPRTRREGSGAAIGFGN